MDIIKKVPVQPEAIKKLSKSVTEQFQLAFMREASRFLEEFYPGITLGIPIMINNRLTKTAGYFQTKHTLGREEASQISISGVMVRHGYAVDDIETVVQNLRGILYHELVHYALFQKGEPNDDGHPHFESELARTGAPSSYATKVTKKYSKVKIGYYVAVDDFGEVVYRHEARNLKNPNYKGTEIRLVEA